MENQQKRVRGSWSFKHGDRNARLYSIWKQMRKRCKKLDDKYYGARGIKVCKEWGEYIPFKQWALANGYTKDLTIERLDVNGNYEPSNCSWIPFVEQANNKRNSHKVVYQGRTQTISQWARELNLDRRTINWRILKGWSVQEAIEEPIRPIKHK